MAKKSFVAEVTFNKDDHKDDPNQYENNEKLFKETEH